ncbi:MAG: hypothetical protein WCO26_19680 [Deltaproteobacteria bacterium]
MAEKGLTRQDFEELFTGFEKRQDEKLMGLEDRVDEKFKGLDQRFNGLEDRVDEKFKGLDERFNGIEERVVNQFHVIAEGLTDHIKLLAEGHTGIINRLDRTEKENERQHLETRALVKLSFAELDRRLSDLELQMKEMQEWKKKVETRLQT